MSTVAESLARWRNDARRAVAARLTPSSIAWDDDGSGRQLFGVAISELGEGGVRLPVPRRFIALAASVACHRAPERWGLLYQLLWRISGGERHLLEIASDPVMHRLLRMHRAVRRSSHKMKAFVRFRAVPVSAEDVEFVAWFEPEHRVVERTAPFFAERFPSMRWSILTPDGCARWDGTQVILGPGVDRAQAPAADDHLEELWRTYYASIFNPSRLNRSAMRAEMPARYWKNLPEASLIAPLSRDAPRRMAAMLAQSLSAPEPLPEALEARAEVGWDATHDPGWREARRRADGITTRPAFGSISYGVAGWTDPTLLAPGVFYPGDATTPEARLRFYASQLTMVEVDATYYSLPSESTSRAWVERTPEGFVFDVKAHALMTGHPTETARLPAWIRETLPPALRSARRVYGHHLDGEVMDEVWRRFTSALEPLRAAGKLGAIMLQYPKWFHPTRDSARALEQARDRLGDLPAAVEVRHRDWLSDRIAPRFFDLLRRLQFTYVAVDGPQGMESSVPPVLEVTNPDLAIVRFHGRRESTWEARNEVVTERYRYLYTPRQLGDWVDAIERAAFQTKHMHLVFNNNHANYATTNALEMASLREPVAQGLEASDQNARKRLAAD